MGRHAFHAVAFAENFALEDLAASYGALRRPTGALLLARSLAALTRDRRLVLLEATIVVLVVLEIGLSLIRGH